MNTIEETFKTEKEILEEFFTNRVIYTIRKTYFSRLSRSCIGFEYCGRIKNPQELNIINLYDLLEYLKPCFIYAESDIKKIKEKIKEKHADDLVMYQNHYFDVDLVLRSKKPSSPWEHEINLGFVEDEYREKIIFMFLLMQMK